MPVFELELDDGRKLQIDADSQDAALAGYAHFQKQEEAAKAPSGFRAGLSHGAQELFHGNAETAKDFYGVGDGYKPTDTNYVPANLTNGSVNPLNWNWSQAGQKIAEQAPGLTQDIGAATLASKVAPGGLKGKALAGLVGGALSAWQRTAGDTAKDTAVNRTGNADATPEGRDLVQGGLTAAASSALGALAPTRFIPGANKIGTVGVQGALDATKKYLATAAIGGGSSAASDAVTQLGTQLGTDKAFDPQRTLEAGAGGLVTSGAMAAPRGAADAARAASLREFGGSNMDATKNYATRLQTAGEDTGLGNIIGGSKNDYQAHENVKTDLKNELNDAARNVRRDIQLSPEADNALQRAQAGAKVSPKEIDTITRETAAAPDGANAAFLANTLRMANLAQERGSYGKDAWAGGVSGVMDKNLGFMLNPVRIGGGAIASMAGMHLLGLSNPMFAGSVTGAYLGSRILDSLMGTRSPAKTFADHFADRNAQLRMPQTAQAAPMAPPSAPAPAMPWGPVPPASGPTGPTVAPPGAAPQAPQMPWGPKPLPTTSVPPVAPPAAPAAAPQATPPLPAGITALLNQRAQMQQPTPTPEPTDLLGTVKAAMAAKDTAAKITKSKGKVESTAPEADLFASVKGGYEPLPEGEMLHPRDMTPAQYADLHVNDYMPNANKQRKDAYRAAILDTASARHNIIEAGKAENPLYHNAFDGLRRQLYKVGNNKPLAVRAINHYADHLPHEAAAVLKRRFSHEADRIWPQK